LRISQITSGAPVELSPVILSLLIAVILIPIILTIIEIIRTKKQKKPLVSRITYDNQIISIAGEAQREPWKDREVGLPNYLSGDEYFLAYEWERSRSSYGVSTFCNKISLTIRNEGVLPIDTDACKESLAIQLDVRGKLSNAKVLTVSPSNERLDLSANNGKLVVKHIHIEPRESLKIVFLGYFVYNMQ
jgi:hypothetical protein